MFVAPSAALADCGGGPSAKNVYSECLPGGSGGKPTNTPPTSTQQGTSAPVSSRTANALRKAGDDSRTLAGFLHGSRRVLPSSHAESGAGPSTLGSAFDLGSGPLALLAALAGTALLLLGGSGLRIWRSRHRV